eukprot:Protomagalhaensia_sp_Gyna_25__2331@NODE_2285_length_1174_cov_8_918062_g1892_i0_p1_GENE_NODE_2285_length_1174_cov_8_918062_g1892_i0NODE_2285_length_1174_cov_8_918062_g1892_i0_p1_ORF_typecomplete_len289_score22_41OTU/PF02338_19/3_6e26Peptidase_C65/PF10275_9/0_4Peptidase_C65/PF10275_9/0_72Nt_Gln_amidase/PF09764_9/0_15DUF3293/PF11697_8/1DUF3293/PF11697_8/2_9e02_NODE_2285_length_1174_cov_8_918062_g1892_i02431109
MAKKKNKEKQSRRSHHQQQAEKWKKHHPSLPIWTGDNKAQHQRLATWLQSNSLRWVNIVADGNCLFRSFSDQLHGHQEGHLEIRAAIVAYIANHETRFSVFLDESDGDIGEYCQKMSRNSTWGGQIEIQAFSLMYGVNVLIHQSSLVALEIINWPVTHPCAQLAYEEGEHYSSVQIELSLMAVLVRARAESQWGNIPCWQEDPWEEFPEESAIFRSDPEWTKLYDHLMTASEIRNLATWTPPTRQLFQSLQRFRHLNNHLAILLPLRRQLQHRNWSKILSRLILLDSY